MRDLLKVFNVESVSLNLNDSTFIFVHITIVRGAENGYYAGELLRFLPVMNFIALNLDLVSSDDESQVVFIK
jgi:hypothetical protein